MVVPHFLGKGIRYDGRNSVFADCDDYVRNFLLWLAAEKVGTHIESDLFSFPFFVLLRKSNLLRDAFPAAVGFTDASWDPTELAEVDATVVTYRLSEVA